MRIKHPTTKRAAIYKQKNSPYWYLDYYIDIEGKTKRKQINSKTEDKDKAFDQLNEIILVNRLVREGKIDLKDTHYKSVNEIAKIIIKTLEPSIKQKPIHKAYIRKLKEIEKHYKKFDIKKLKKAELRNYFNKLEYSQTQLRITRKAFLYIFEYAEENNYIEVIPTFPKVVLKEKNRRESFDIEKLDILKERYLKKSVTTKNKIAKENFELLYYFVSILEETGIRYGELRELETKNIIKDNGNTLLKLDKSKTSKRTVLISIQAAFLIMKINHKQKYLFERKDGVIPNFTQIFKTDKESDEKYFKSLNIFDKTIYCIRHTFINKKIKEGKDLYQIAIHCGTSLKMIEDWYSDMIVNSDYNNIYDDQKVDLLDQLADQIGRDFEQTKKYHPEKIIDDKDNNDFD
jgi:integrase